jgi:hypothetical protein
MTYLKTTLLARLSICYRHNLIGLRDGTSGIYAQTYRLQNVLSIETHRRAATGNTRSREAPGTAGGSRSLGQCDALKIYQIKLRAREFRSKT